MESIAVLAPLAVLGFACYALNKSTSEAAKAAREARAARREVQQMAKPPPIHVRELIDTDFYVRSKMGVSHTQRFYAGDRQVFKLHPITGQMVTYPITATGMEGEGVC
jgi:hypothetical protein